MYVHGGLYKNVIFLQRQIPRSVAVLYRFFVSNRRLVRRLHFTRDKMVNERV